ncbi:unnamed protein product [Protopolystoma xenopodis]|uniref:Uncharacterized protein n=1 Tax=Protopolystoma xenopodis TaxID=117903 RepID=A0A3S5CMF2_9PLAT|nr:unnamed protein product [Protopolystoma xenopodis]
MAACLLWIRPACCRGIFNRLLSSQPQRRIRRLHELQVLQSSTLSFRGRPTQSLSDVQLPSDEEDEEGTM